MNTKVLAITLSLAGLMSGSASAASVSGQVDSLINALFTADNYVVVLKPGWIADGCSGTTTAAFNGVFTPASSYNVETYDRSFVVALTAYTTNAPVKLYTQDVLGAACSSLFFNSIRIDE